MLSNSIVYREKELLKQYKNDLKDSRKSQGGGSYSDHQEKQALLEILETDSEDCDSEEEAKDYSP